MLRNILSVLGGLIVSFIVIVIGEGITHNLFPMPASIDSNNPEAIKTFISSAPVSFHLGILLIYGLASLAGALIASIITTDKKMSKAMTVGGILMGLGIFNLISLSHPLWAIICGFIVFLPFAFAGGLVGITLSARKK